MWSPYSYMIGEVNSIESIQKFALRMYEKIGMLGIYEQLLELFSLPDLQQHRLYLDLCSCSELFMACFIFQVLYL